MRAGGPATVYSAAHSCQSDNASQEQQQRETTGNGKVLLSAPTVAPQPPKHAKTEPQHRCTGPQRRIGAGHAAGPRRPPSTRPAMQVRLYSSCHCPGPAALLARPRAALTAYAAPNFLPLTSCMVSEKFRQQRSAPMVWAAARLCPSGVRAEPPGRRTGSPYRKNCWQIAPTPGRQRPRRNELGPRPAPKASGAG